MLKDDKEEIINFSWNRVYSEFLTRVPCLVNLLRMINPKVLCYKPFVCVLISMMVKCRNPKLALIQRVFSVFLYGNGVHKEVKNCNYIPYCLYMYYLIGLQNVPTFDVMFIT